jgi:signal transduction histidine kinase
LADDGKTLRYFAATGLTDEIMKEVVHVDRSPLNQRVLAGETQVQGRVGEPKGLQLQSELTAVGILSAALAPLRVADKVIGTLGIYSDKLDRFQDRDVLFLGLAAELVAIAIEDARANEAIEALMNERTQFMLEVAHNLRSPLSASLEIVEVLRNGYLGEVNERQKEYLERIDHRLRSLHKTIGGLLTIARTRDWSHEIPDVVVDINELARHTQRTFEEQAAAKKLRFAVVAEPDLPTVDSGADLLEQIVENLVGNAIKYTPDGGSVEVLFSRHGADEVWFVVEDSGIGIPQVEQGKLFREFFRASNAKKHTSEGTGLGLALVKQSVERHRGRIELTSDEGRGTTVVIGEHNGCLVELHAEELFELSGSDFVATLEAKMRSELRRPFRIERIATHDPGLEVFTVVSVPPDATSDEAVTGAHVVHPDGTVQTVGFDMWCAADGGATPAVGATDRPGERKPSPTELEDLRRLAHGVLATLSIGQACLHLPLGEVELPEQATQDRLVAVLPPDFRVWADGYGSFAHHDRVAASWQIRPLVPFGGPAVSLEIRVEDYRPAQPEPEWRFSPGDDPHGKRASARRADDRNS